jgi:hypothetical protein
VARRAREQVGGHVDDGAAIERSSLSEARRSAGSAIPGGREARAQAGEPRALALGSRPHDRFRHPAGVEACDSFGDGAGRADGFQT